MKKENNVRRSDRGSRLLRAALVYALVFVSVFSAVSAARYISGETAGDSARVAAFAASANTDVSRISIDLNKATQAEKLLMKQQIPFTVSNLENGKPCETAMRYDVIVTANPALPAQGIALALDEDGKLLTGSGANWTIENVGTLAAGSVQIVEHNLLLIADEVYLENNYTGNLSISVRFTQIQ